MKIRQKLEIGVFLCLNVCVIIVALIRISGAYYYGTIDKPWFLLLQQVEACVAITMISLTAFRSVFIAGVSKLRDGGEWKKKHPGPWVPSISRAFRQRNNRASEDRELGLTSLTVPSAMFAGLPTLTGRGNGTQTLVRNGDERLNSDHSTAN